MLYEYQCTSCQLVHEEYRPIIDFTRIVQCPCCGAESWLKISGGGGFMGARDEREYNPGLGCVVRNAEHRAQICRERGLVEVGNERMDHHIDTMDIARAAKLAARYQE